MPDTPPKSEGAARVVAVIPARFASTRLPGKPLAMLAGKPLVRWVWEAALRCREVGRVVVATDDPRIEQAAREFGAETVMTPEDCPSGTDRAAATLRAIDGGQDGGPAAIDIVVNIQGDEPLMDPATVDAAVRALRAAPDADVASAMTPIADEADYLSPSVVKVVTDSRAIALYFSRAPIPDVTRLTPAERAAAPAPRKHLGLYVYRRAALEKIVTLPPGRYETLEKLEQLRFLEAGYRIVMFETPADAVGVDTPDDIPKAERLLRERWGL